METETLDYTEQEDELLALSSIYDDTGKLVLQDRKGSFTAHFMIPSDFEVILLTDKSKPLGHKVQYMPPLTLFFELPKDYPSKSPPSFQLSCAWLNKRQLTTICKELDRIWRDNQNTVVLYSWTAFLEEDILKFLNIQSPLDFCSAYMNKNSTPVGSRKSTPNKGSETQNRKDSNASKKALSFEELPAKMNVNSLITSDSSECPTLAKTRKQSVKNIQPYSEEIPQKKNSVNCYPVPTTSNISDQIASLRLQESASSQKSAAVNSQLKLDYNNGYHSASQHDYCRNLQKGGDSSRSSVECADNRASCSSQCNSPPPIPPYSYILPGEAFDPVATPEMQMRYPHASLNNPSFTSNGELSDASYDQYMSAQFSNQISKTKAPPIPPYDPLFKATKLSEKSPSNRGKRNISPHIPPHFLPIRSEAPPVPPYDPTISFHSSVLPYVETSAMSATMSSFSHESLPKAAISEAPPVPPYSPTLCVPPPVPPYTTATVQSLPKTVNSEAPPIPPYSPTISVPPPVPPYTTAKVLKATSSFGHKSLPKAENSEAPPIPPYSPTLSVPPPVPPYTTTATVLKATSSFGHKSLPKAVNSEAPPIPPYSPTISVPPPVPPYTTAKVLKATSSFGHKSLPKAENSEAPPIPPYSPTISVPPPVPPYTATATVLNATSSFNHKSLPRAQKHIKAKDHKHAKRMMINLQEKQTTELFPKKWFDNQQANQSANLKSTKMPADNKDMWDTPCTAPIPMPGSSHLPLTISVNANATNNRSKVKLSKMKKHGTELANVPVWNRSPPAPIPTPEQCNSNSSVLSNGCAPNLIHPSTRHIESALMSDSNIWAVDPPSPIPSPPKRESNNLYHSSSEQAITSSVLQSCYQPQNSFSQQELPKSSFFRVHSAPGLQNTKECGKDVNSLSTSPLTPSPQNGDALYGLPLHNASREQESISDHIGTLLTPPETASLPFPYAVRTNHQNYIAAPLEDVSACCLHNEYMFGDEDEHITSSCSSMSSDLGECSPVSVPKVVDEPVDQKGGSDIEIDDRILDVDMSLTKLSLYVKTHNKQHKEKVFLESMFQCGVCFTEYKGLLCTSFSPCDHIYCKSCIQAFFMVQINDGNIKGLNCPFIDCDSTASTRQVKELVTKEAFERYDRLLLQATLDMMSDIVYCPRPQCGTACIADQQCNMAQCSQCSYAFCIFCKLTYHGASPCKIDAEQKAEICRQYTTGDEETKKRLEKLYGRKTIKQITEDNFTEAWLEENSKKCPHCKAHIQKVEGCHRMLCTKCGEYFCWLCLSIIPKVNPYLHFNVPGTQCYNKLFHGITDEDDDQEFEDIDDFVD